MPSINFMMMAPQCQSLKKLQLLIKYKLSSMKTLVTIMLSLVVENDSRILNEDGLEKLFNILKINT